MRSRELGNIMSSARQYMHDLEQGKRRTDEQNRAIVDIIRANGEDRVWYYSDVPEEGGVVTLGQIGGPEWTIDEEGGGIKTHG